MEFAGQARPVGEDLLRLGVEVLLREFLTVLKLEHLRILRYLELSSQILDDALEQVEGVLIEVGSHHRLVMRTVLHEHGALVVLDELGATKLRSSAWVQQVLARQLADMGPEVDERLVDLLDVGRLLDSGLLRGTVGWDLQILAVDLELELLLNVSPEKSKQILRIFLVVQLPVLVQISVL